MMPVMVTATITVRKAMGDWWCDITPERLAAAKEKKRLRRMRRAAEKEREGKNFYMGGKGGGCGRVVPQHNKQDGWYKNQILSTLCDSCTDEEYERIFGRPAHRLNCKEEG